MLGARACGGHADQVPQVTSPDVVEFAPQEGGHLSVRAVEDANEGKDFERRRERDSHCQLGKSSRVCALRRSVRERLPGRAPDGPTSTKTCRTPIARGGPRPSGPAWKRCWWRSPQNGCCEDQRGDRKAMTRGRARSATAAGSRPSGPLAAAGGMHVDKLIPAAEPHGRCRDRSWSPVPSDGGRPCQPRTVIPVWSSRAKGGVSRRDDRRLRSRSRPRKGGASQRSRASSPPAFQALLSTSTAPTTRPGTSSRASWSSS